MNYNNYEELDKLLYPNGGVKRVLIDGTVTGCGKCTGICKYKEHMGYLTEKLKKEHLCVEHKCDYFVPRTKKEDPAPSPFTEISRQMQQEFEDFKRQLPALIPEDECVFLVGEPVLLSFRECKLLFASFFGKEPMERAVQKIQEVTGWDVEGEEVKNSLERAYEMVLKKAA